MAEPQTVAPTEKGSGHDQEEVRRGARLDICSL